MLQEEYVVPRNIYQIFHISSLWAIKPSITLLLSRTSLLLFWEIFEEALLVILHNFGTWPVCEATSLGRFIFIPELFMCLSSKSCSTSLRNINFWKEDLSSSQEHFDVFVYMFLDFSWAFQVIIRILWSRYLPEANWFYALSGITKCSIVIMRFKVCVRNEMDVIVRPLYVV